MCWCFKRTLNATLARSHPYLAPQQTPPVPTMPRAGSWTALVRSQDQNQVKTRLRARTAPGPSGQVADQNRARTGADQTSPLYYSYSYCSHGDHFHYTWITT